MNSLPLLYKATNYLLTNSILFYVNNSLAMNLLILLLSHLPLSLDVTNSSTKPSLPPFALLTPLLLHHPPLMTPHDFTPSHDVTR